MTGTDNGHDSGGCKQHYFFSAWRSGTGGYEALSTPRGTSSAFCIPVEICWHLQHAGTRHGSSQAHTAVSEPPQSRCTRIDGAVAMTWALPFCSTMYICGFCRVPAQCRWLWPLPRVPKDLGSQYTSSGKSSWAAGASHWDFPWTFPSLVLNQVHLFCLHTIVLKIRKWLPSYVQEGRDQFACQCFWNRYIKIKQQNHLKLQSPPPFSISSNS